MSGQAPVVPDRMLNGDVSLLLVVPPSDCLFVSNPSFKLSQPNSLQQQCSSYAIVVVNEHMLNILQKLGEFYHCTVEV